MAKATAEKTQKNSKPVNRVTEELDVPEAMQVQVVRFRIKGTSPLLQNNPVEFIRPQTGEDGLGQKKVYIDEEEAKIRTYQTQDGKFFHPGQAFRKSMLRASTGRRIGKKSAPGVLRGVAFVLTEQAILLGKNGKPLKKYEIDRRSVVNPANKARVLRCRPVWPEWQTEISFEIDAQMLPAKVLWQVLMLAGRTVGVGDFRPEKDGSFGRFEVEMIE